MHTNMYHVRDLPFNINAKKMVNNEDKLSSNNCNNCAELLLILDIFHK